MTDFHQEGIITTLHALYEGLDRESYLAKLEQKLEEYARHLKISLLLPSLHSELKNPDVIDRIVSSIQQVQYLHNIVIALGGRPRSLSFRRPKSTLADSETANGMSRLCGLMDRGFRRSSRRSKSVKYQRE